MRDDAPTDMRLRFLTITLLCASFAVSQVDFQNRDEMLQRLKSAFGEPEAKAGLLLYKTSRLKIVPTFDERGHLAQIDAVLVSPKDTFLNVAELEELRARITRVEDLGDFKYESKMNGFAGVRAMNLSRYEKALLEQCVRVDIAPDRATSSTGVYGIRVLYLHHVSGRIRHLDFPHQQETTKLGDYTATTPASTDWTVAEVDVAGRTYFVPVDAAKQLEVGSEATFQAFGPTRSICD